MPVVLGCIELSWHDRWSEAVRRRFFLIAVWCALLSLGANPSSSREAAEGLDGVWTAIIPDAFPRYVYTWHLLADGTYREDGRDAATRAAARRWKAVVLRFKEWLTHDDLSRVTPEKVQAWGDEKVAAGITAKTVNDTDFAALRAVFKWGKKRMAVFQPCRRSKDRGAREESNS
jgi:hypothetical protein